jgi:hypothetical protein
MNNNYRIVFNKNLLLFKQYSKRTTKEDKVLIKAIANRWSINPNILFGIYLVETINRGGKINNLVERIICLSQNIMLILNPSIGVCQIRLSTAREIEPSIDNKELIEKLLIKKDNLEICAKLIASYKRNQINSNLDIIKLFTTGSLEVPNYIWIVLYNDLISWSINNNLIEEH